DVITFDTNNFKETKKLCIAPNHKIGLNLIIEKLSTPPISIIKDKGEISAIGHRYVNIGDKIKNHAVITGEIMDKLKDSLDLAPLHNPPNYTGIEVSLEVFKGKPNIIVFDNIFHKDIPSKAYLYGIPYDYYEKYRIRKYGFHGIAYTYMVSRVSELLGVDYKKMKIIALMLGGGSSITAIRNGKTIDTSMGFTPAEGLFMSTRSGDLDPAIIGYLMKKENLNPAEIDEIINQKSGLLGLSRKYKNFLDIESGVITGDIDCIRAFDSYTYRIKKYIGSYTAAMDGLDLIIFGGGIGENSPITRKAILDDMDYFGVRVDNEKNNNLVGEQVISNNDSKIPVVVVRVNEEIIIARVTYDLVKARN
ncbi:MAG: acetate/propionate family kinase, partial [Actinobacteria bacterium]|nr:acetate/propionate family kinase [Actinomycetota bacterium]